MTMNFWLRLKIHFIKITDLEHAILQVCKVGSRLKMKTVLIIAEAGVNHNGSVQIARKSIEVAKNQEQKTAKFQHLKL